MRRRWIAIGTMLLAASALHGQLRRRAVSPVDDTISIEFVDVAAGDGSLTRAQGNAWLDVGTVFKREQREKGIRVRRAIGMRLVRSGGVQYGTARLTAKLQSWDGQSSVRIDGQPLTSAPLLVDSRAPIGPVLTHRMEIVVPETGKPGPIDASIVWEVTTDP
jgi:hypothetical protein